MDEIDDLTELDEALDLFIAKMNLVYERCHLNHGEGVKPPKATEYLCQWIGKDGQEEFLFRIPICDECAEALYDEEWLLFYCLTCNSSKWLLKSRAKKYYPKWESIRFLSECPICTENKEKLEK